MTTGQQAARDAADKLHETGGEYLLLYGSDGSWWIVVWVLLITFALGFWVGTIGIEWTIQRALKRYRADQAITRTAT